jgi:predicted nucleic acid-binding protein
MQAIAGFDLVGLDSCVFIYLYERHPLYYPIVLPIFSLLDANKLRGSTSLITLTEVLILPLRQKRLDLVSIYNQAILNAPTLTAVPVNAAIAAKAAELRAGYNLRTPDAIQIATAIETGAKVFITNDARLKSISEITVLILADFLL